MVLRKVLLLNKLNAHNDQNTQNTAKMNGQEGGGGRERLKHRTDPLIHTDLFWVAPNNC